MKVFAISILCMFVVAAAYFIFLQHGYVPPSQNISFEPALSSVISSTSKTVAQPRSMPEGYKEYRSDTYHFSLICPETLEVSEHDDGGGAFTIVFQNVKLAEGFQIFIVPYAQQQVSEEQFKRDEPSGVRTHVQHITIDGVTGTAFDSSDTNLGDIHEVWFIRGGYLYEITTLKPLEEWFVPILGSWKFT